MNSNKGWYKPLGSNKAQGVRDSDGICRTFDELSHRTKTKTTSATSTTGSSAPKRKPKHAKSNANVSGSTVPIALTLYNDNPMHLMNGTGGWDLDSGILSHENDPILGAVASDPPRTEIQTVRPAITARLSYETLYDKVATETKHATEEWAEESVSRDSNPLGYPHRTAMGLPMRISDITHDTATPSSASGTHDIEPEEASVQSGTWGLWSFFELLRRFAD